MNIRKAYWTILLAISPIFFGCNDWLDRESKTILNEDQIYSSVGTINGVVSGLYQRLPDWGGIYQDLGYYTHMDEAMLGTNVNNHIYFADNYATYYEGGYNLLKEVNYHIVKLNNTSILSADQKKYYLAEARFLRLYIYFELVKRMGGVPLITDPMIFESGVPISNYQIARSKESDIYNFIKDEVDAIKEDLNLPASAQYNRASKGVALALKCRAMLYAASLAKYNSAMSLPITLPNGEVGIPASMADDYYRECISAADELLGMTNVYELYDKNASKSENFYNALTTSPVGGQNKELIFIKEFSDPSITHKWTYDNLPRTMRIGGFGGSGGTFINPSLNLIDAFENIDGTTEKLMPYTDVNHPDEISSDSQFDGNPDAYKYYTNQSEIFQNKDPRLAGTILLPGSMLGAKSVNYQAGLAVFNSTTNKLEFKIGSLEKEENNVITLDGVTYSLTGLDGPSADPYSTRTGFYVKKSMQSNNLPESKNSSVPWVRYRLAEVYLNAAEAAFELGNYAPALAYLKPVRDRAGITTGSSTTLEQIRNERRIELAFEGHRLFDLRRWRIADELFDGLTSNPNAMIYGLWPYKVYRPGHVTHDKWVFVRRIPTAFTAPRKFVRANYYSAIPSGALSANPKLVKNPGH